MSSIRQFSTFKYWKYVSICTFNIRCWKYVSIVRFSACKNISKCTFYRTTFYVKYIWIIMRSRCAWKSKLSWERLNKKYIIFSQSVLVLKANLLTHTHRRSFIQSSCPSRSHLFEIHNSFVLALDMLSNETSVALRPEGLLWVPRKGKDTLTLSSRRCASP